MRRSPISPNLPPGREGSVQVLWLGDPACADRALVGDAGLAVLVQRLIAAHVAALAFSANPLTGARDEVVVDASWGLGESIVGGGVTPDSYAVRRRDLAVTARRVADKQRMSILV